MSENPPVLVYYVWIPGGEEVVSSGFSAWIQHKKKQGPSEGETYGLHKGNPLPKT